VPSADEKTSVILLWRRENTCAALFVFAGVRITARRILTGADASALWRLSLPSERFSVCDLIWRTIWNEFL